MHLMRAGDGRYGRDVGPLLGLAISAAAGAALALWLMRPAAARRTPEVQAALERAVALVDRELAADLELMSMFDQTKQPFVLENGQFLAVRSVLESAAPSDYAFVADVYARIPAVETSMERRGPAGSIPDADQRLIHEWEGDAREAQRVLRSALTPVRRARWSAVAERLRARFPVR
jgi:hypothetical protein